MLKYGIDNFEIKELEYLKEGGKLLSDREIYWIEKLGTYGSNGYNATKGGDGTLIYNYDEIIKLYNEYKSINQVSKILNCDKGTINKVLNIYNINTEERKARSKAKVVEQYSLDEKLLNTFNSCYQAGSYLKTIIDSPSDGKKMGRNIGRCANGERKQLMVLYGDLKNNPNYNNIIDVPGGILSKVAVYSFTNMDTNDRIKEGLFTKEEIVISVQSLD